MNRIRRTGKMPGLGFNALVLTTIGRKSGLQRQTPVGLVLQPRRHPGQVWSELPGP
jgi:hypothetical protein